ncbi:hypothetical protein R5R35_005575 [Gryllus longicercus]|uniref:Cilia-and flagella-associated protein 96 n=1 Tax=Gryllus longicercus TaxID=2509291 RepID=A0AAN9VN86_9ORTH
MSAIPFNSTFVMKHSSTPGDFYGTFEENIIPAMSPLTRPEKRVPEKPNFLGFVPKKGNGGYVNICINKYPERISKVDKYDAARELYTKSFAQHKKNMKGAPFAVSRKCSYFDENPYKTDKIMKTYKETKEKPYRRGPEFVVPGPGKKLGGNKSGCFDKYPPHSADKYLSAKQIEKELIKKMVKPTRDSGIMRPAGIPKKWRIQSEIPYNIQFRVHAKNWRCAEPFVYFKPC